MPEISLTDFVDFVSTAGTPKLSVVRRIKQRGAYDPRFDFWKPLREGIISFHQTGQTNRSHLDSIVNGLTDEKKIGLYPGLVAGYKRFLGRRNYSWFRPPSANWQSNNLSVRVNPELGLDLNGARHIIKLYFKADPLASNRVSIIQLLMREALTVTQGDVLAVLEVSRAREFASASLHSDLLPLLEGEAANFVTIWNRV